MTDLGSSTGLAGGALRLVTSLGSTLSSGAKSLLSSSDLMLLASSDGSSLDVPSSGLSHAVTAFDVELDPLRSPYSNHSDLLSALRKKKHKHHGGDKAPQGIVASMCRDREGWGPVSKLRDLDLTPCFEQATLLVLPAFLFAIFAAFTLSRLVKSPRRPLSRASNSVLIAKLVVIGLLVVTSLLSLSLAYGTERRPFSALPLYSALFLSGAHALALPLTWYNHTRERRSSTLLLLYWLISLAFSAIVIRTDVNTAGAEGIKHHLAAFVMRCVSAGLVLVVFALECAGTELGNNAGSAREAKHANGGAAGQEANGNGYHAVPQADESAFTVATADDDDGAGPSNADPAARLGPAVGLHGEKECPENTANIFSQLSFNWMNGIMKLGSKKWLTEEDLWALPPGEDAENLGKRFEHFFNRTRGANGEGKPRIWFAMGRAFGGPFLVAAFLKAAQDILSFAQPQVLRRLLQFVQTWEGPNPEPAAHGFALAFLLFLLALGQTAVLHQYFQRCFVTGMRVRAGLVSAIFRKTLVLSNEDRGQRSTGSTVNIMSVDASRLQDFCTYAQILWSALLQITLAVVSLYNLLGWAALAGVAVMVVSVPLNTMLARYLRSLSEQQMKVRDRRTKFMSEILTNIKSIKLFAWEPFFTAKLNGIRNDEELRLLKRTGIFGAVFNGLFSIVPFCVSLAAFATYTFTNPKPLTPDVIFPALSLFSLLQFPLAMLAGIISALIQAQVSAQRISEFLSAGELDPNARKIELPDQPGEQLVPSAGAEEGEPLVTIKDGEFKWGKQQPVATLQDINLTVRKGELLAVLGRVGDGKSSLLSAVLGEMNRTDGQVTVRGRTAYFVQGGWCMGATVRDNILFGLKYEPDFYKRVLEACALEPDLAILPDGDRTEIGEKGVSLSGGQKARVALARAVYARADIYLLDDPLAAVDAHVGAHIFKHVIGPEGLLKSKARILTTNTVGFLPQFDQIVCLRRGIILEERGTYEEVMSRKGEISNLINGLGKQGAKEQKQDDASAEETHEVESNEPSFVQNETGDGQTKEIKVSRRLSTASMRRPKALTPKQIKRDTIRQLKQSTQLKEKSKQGEVSWDVYKQYARSSSVVGVACFFVAQIMTQLLQIGRDVVLKQWGSHNAQVGQQPGDKAYYLGLYATLGVCSSLAVCIAPLILYAFLIVRSAKAFHDGMFRSVLRSPLQWFEQVPTGTILNLFSRDVQVIDEVLPRVLQGFFRTLIVVAGVLSVISYSVPPFLLAIPPLWFIYRAILRYYLASSRELKRLDAVSKSPIFTWFQESLGGLSTIRAFGQEARFQAVAEARVDRNQQCYFPSVSCNRWLAVRIEFLGSSIILFSATFAVLLITRGGRMDAGLLGLMMSQALSTTQALNWVIRSASEVETNIVSVERVISYSDLTSEKAYESPEDVKPPAAWPSHGEVEFRDYSTRYREGLDLVLKNLNIKIRAGEKIGVVGRTGAGKSSLTLALFRIIEPASGTIFIDGVDCSRIGLKELRRALAIIPQEPQLWEGSVRENLDPTGQSSDDALWNALDKAKLKEKINRIGGLEAMLTEGASNLSAGERQLVCIARALLRDAKILVLDEATASIDLESEHLLRQAVADFNGTTITIAHRLNTVESSDRILVLNQGEVVEFDEPKKLLENKDGIYRGMAKEAKLI